MRILAFPLATVLALTIAAPAAALTKGQEQCPLELADAKLSQKLVSQMVDHEDGDDIDENVLTGMLEVYQTCVKREKVPQAQQDDYMTYVTEAIAVAEQTRQLKAAGINPATIDKAFGIGPGGRNPKPDEISDNDFERLASMLAQDGVQIEKLAKREIGLIGAYAALAADLWEVRDRLR